MPAATTLRARQGDTLDALLWRDAGLGPADLPAVLAANPGIAEAGPVLPIGTIVIVPATQAIPATATRPLIQLWD
ncbi:phage tail protein X [Sphingomonas sp. SORGH_AS802]|uniref:tail protein X n=1 Tax=Sphingomonas sp. SORGH_AS_0802 TaxID=3041800 RepID=UPI002867073E|nr:tail protein X [Sphingomonas sp. SORGH_AS_0802]MDR6133056.1 phage tail protein X [Sphingomonas sp. SORGH_AS_0802]